MFIYKNLFETYGKEGWKGVALPTPFYSNLYMPFNEADNFELSDVAINHLLIQRDDVSIYSTSGSTVSVGRRPENIGPNTITKRNEFTEFNGDMNGNAEGGDLTFGGEAIEAVVIRRSSSRSKFHIWEDIAIIPITTSSLYTLDKIIYDPYVEHGITYQYAIQPIGSNGRGAQYETLRNKAVYDDIWMIGSDTKQLMMGYNPMVSGYKYVVKDSAIETIGSKYPYVIRNANVGYIQFQFSCTITAHMNLVDGKETFTPFSDIEVEDEYKDIIVGEGGSGSTGGVEGIPDRPRPTPEKRASFFSETKFRTRQREEDSTNKVLIRATSTMGPYTVLEEGLTGSVVKIQLPISAVEAAGLVNLREEAITNNQVEMYDNWVNGYERTDSLGNIIIQPPHDWIPAYADESNISSMSGGEQHPEVVKLRMEGFEKTNEELEKEIKTVESRIAKGKESRLFDPAYPSSPDIDRSGIISNATVVNSDNEYMLEREFRNRVVQFLYDGSPKIFKSPTEGLLLVKLTEISLTPNVTLGRMIYDFSCTCTEIGKVNSETLAKYGFRESKGNVPISYVPEVEKEMGAEEVNNLYELFRNK